MNRYSPPTSNARRTASRSDQSTSSRCRPGGETGLVVVRRLTDGVVPVARTIRRNMERAQVRRSDPPVRGWIAVSIALLLAAGSVVFSAPAASAATPASTTSAPASPAGQKPRMILTQDGEVDDMDSFIRFLYYSNEFDIAGIIYTSSTYHYSGNGSNVNPFRWTGLEWVNHYIDLYDQIRPNLIKHASGYPTADELRALYKVGNITNVGESTLVTEGSEWIKAKIMDPDTRPLYIQSWGGNNTTARALKSIQEQYQNTPDWPAVQA